MTEQPKYWWLGFNTRSRRTEDEKGIYLNAELQDFLDGQTDHYDWPTTGTNDSPRYYNAMSRSDRAVIWTGGGSGYRGPWGVLAFVTIVDRSDASSTSPGWIRLSHLERFVPVTPFDESIEPAPRTANSDFLADLFGEEFQPLHKVFRDLGYPTRIRGRDGTRRAVTAWKLEPAHFWALFRRAKRLTAECQSRRAA